MSLFCIIALDAANSDQKRKQHLDAHVANLKQLKQKGKLIAAGPFMQSHEANASECGSMLVVDFDTQKAAEDWYKNDPYSRAGVYQTLEVRPYIDAMSFLE